MELECKEFLTLRPDSHLWDRKVTVGKKPLVCWSHTTRVIILCMESTRARVIKPGRFQSVSLALGISTRPQVRPRRIQRTPSLGCTSGKPIVADMEERQLADLQRQFLSGEAFAAAAAAQILDTIEGDLFAATRAFAFGIPSSF